MNIHTPLAGVLGLLALIFAGSAGQARAQAVADQVDYKTVISKHIEAIGGEAAVKSIKSSKAEGTLGIPAAGLKGTLINVQDEKRMHTKISLSGLGTEQVGRDGDLVWKLSAITGPEIITDKRKASLMRQAKLEPLLSVEEDFETIKYGGVKEFADEQCHVLEMQNKDEKPTYFYFSLKTGLLAGTQATSYDPQQGELEIISKTSDYREVGGVKFAHKTTVVLPNGMEMVTQVDSMEVNKEIDAKLFELPKEIKDLQADK